MLNQKAKVTDLVRIIRVPDKYVDLVNIGDVGRIIKIYSNGHIEQMRVNIFGKSNPHTRSDGHFLFFPSQLVECSDEEFYIEEDLKNTKKLLNTIYGIKGDIMKNKQLLKGYEVAVVEFEVTEAKVHYALYDTNIVPGDYVLCMTGHHGQAIGKVVKIFKDELNNSPVEYGREIICKIDCTAYEARRDKLKRLSELKIAMAKKKEELNELAVYELLAASSPEMADMLKELKGLL